MRAGVEEWTELLPHLLDPTNTVTAIRASDAISELVPVGSFELALRHLRACLADPRTPPSVTEAVRHAVCDSMGRRRSPTLEAGKSEERGQHESAGPLSVPCSRSREQLLRRAVDELREMVGNAVSHAKRRRVR